MATQSTLQLIISAANNLGTKGAQSLLDSIEKVKPTKVVECCNLLR
jgi:hypothetical protein